MPISGGIGSLVRMDAWLWNGKQQLPGVIELLRDRIRFKLKGFPDSHLKLEILLSEIEEIDSFLVFNISRLGILVRSRNGSVDQFILEKPEVFRKALNEGLLNA